MRIEKTPKQTPQGLPASSSSDRQATNEERFVWEVLAPRLLDPPKLAFIRALLQHGKPLSLRELAGAGEISEDRARYHCKSMQKAGVLEVVGTTPRAAGKGDEPSYFFSSPETTD